MKKLFLLFMFLPSVAFAWGGTGHEVVCEIAFQELNSVARHEVERLIELDTEFGSFTESCRWADQLEERAPDHYMNVPRELSAITKDGCLLAETCLFSAIKKDSEILSDRSQSDQARLAALKSLGHWIGDLHQPLHISFQDDRGANHIDAVGSCRGSLHGVWDGCILERQVGKDVAAIANDFLGSITENDRRSWLTDSTIEWANESYQITLSPDTGYCTMKDDGCWYWPYFRTLKKGNMQREMIITQDYLSANQEIVELRLKQAGVRLGALLNGMLEDQ
jgi:hypothetical protein